MSDLKYNFLDDNFLVYKNVEEPKVELNLPLFDEPLELDWADRITEDGSIIVKPDEKVKEQWIFNNPEYVPTSQEKTSSQRTEEQPVQQQVTEQPKPTTRQPQQFTTSSKSTLSRNQQKTVVQIMNGLINRGIDPIKASGIVGNLIGESGYNLNTGAYNSNDVGAPAGGLAGWRGENFTKLKKLAQSRGKHWTDLDTQLDYLVSTIPGDVTNRLSKATNPFEASEAWAYYERYAGYNNSIESARKFQRSKGWSDKRTKEWISAQHKKRGDMSTEIYNLWLANQ